MILYPYFENFTPLQKPPTLYSLLQSKVNFGKSTETKIEDLPEAGRAFVFDFEYEYPSDLNKNEFEIDILTHFLERRIGFETYLSWKLHFKNKIRAIMPYYTKLLESFEELSINDNEILTRSYTDNMDRTYSETTSEQTSGNSENKFSDTPQSQLSNVSNDLYLTDYRKINTSDSGSGSRGITEGNDRTVSETVTRKRPEEDFLKWTERKMQIMEMIYSDLEECFYQLV